MIELSTTLSSHVISESCGDTKLHESLTTSQPAKSSEPKTQYWSIFVEDILPYRMQEGTSPSYFKAYQTIQFIFTKVGRFLRKNLSLNRTQTGWTLSTYSKYQFEWSRTMQIELSSNSISYLQKIHSLLLIEEQTPPSLLGLCKAWNSPSPSPLPSSWNG